jgi:hypothetical protein
LAEEQHQQRQQQQEAQEQQLPQQQHPPLNYITQAEEVRESPAAANEEEAQVEEDDDVNDANYNPNSCSDDDDEEDEQELDVDDDDVDAEELQALQDEERQAIKDDETKLDGEDDSSDPSATAAATSNSGEDPPSASLFTLFLASLTVQRDVPNCPSFADHQQHSNLTEAMATQAAQQQQQQQQQQGEGLHVASHAEVPNSCRGTLVEHLQQAPPRVAVANSRQGIQQQPAQLNNLPFENYRYPNLHDSYTILFPMPTNEVYMLMQ